MKAPDPVAAALGGPPGTRVVLWRSVLSRAGSPWAIREMYVPLGLVDLQAQHLLATDLVDASEVLDKAGLPETAYAHSTSARPTRGDEAELLKSPVALALSVRRVSYSGEQARSCEYVIIRADRVALAGSSGNVPNYGEPDAK
ncbi:UTRA domain-containing protein [Streptomyces alboflavus]|uniref:UTRA domain-containing protein n=1 Tax=Streptomyces alboflavus TaxID=67267 RepID=UPI0013318918|nr:UTRA domain-containing protein [Streptomyces alboflavus]